MHSKRRQSLWDTDLVGSLTTTSSAAHREAVLWVFKQPDGDARHNTPSRSPPAAECPPEVSIALLASLYNIARRGHQPRSSKAGERRAYSSNKKVTAYV